MESSATAHRYSIRNDDQTHFDTGTLFLKFFRNEVTKVDFET